LCFAKRKAGSLTNGCGRLPGAKVELSQPVRCGTAFNGLVATTTTNGDWDYAHSINLGPCATPYRIDAHYTGETRCSSNIPGEKEGCFYFEPADASTTFSIAEAPAAGTGEGSIQSSNNTR